MSKKVICMLAGAVFAIAIYWLGFVNGEYYNESKTEVATEENTAVISHEEMFDGYIKDRYGSDYYGVVRSVRNGYICYDVYENDGYEKYALCHVRTSQVFE